jgi:serine protease inhibitor
MRITRQIIVVVSALLGAAACSSPTDGAQKQQPIINELPRALNSEEQLAAAATTDFGLALFRAVNARTARDSNLALSPMSASLALGMLLNGSELETLDDVRRTLAFSDRPVSQVNAAYKSLLPMLVTLDPSVTMAFANAAWFDSSSAPSATFSQTISDVFDARVSMLKLTAPSSVTTINAWVSAATNARIPKIVDAFSSNDIALLVNATYFKGRWRAQFDASKTHTSAFHVTASDSIQVATMSNTEGLVRLGGGVTSTIVGEIPFGGDAFVMTIVSPPVGTLEATIDGLTATRWRELIYSLQPTTQTLTIELPKFRLETTRTLNQDLISLGMRRPFADAQLNPMFVTPSNQRVVSKVLQKVFIDVNEEGAEAAAATSVGITLTSAKPALIVSRPFIFAIRERLSGTILFMGKVVRPVAP